MQNETLSVNVTAGGGEERNYFTCHEAMVTDMTYRLLTFFQREYNCNNQDAARSMSVKVKGQGHTGQRQGHSCNFIDQQLLPSILENVRTLNTASELVVLFIMTT